LPYLPLSVWIELSYFNSLYHAFFALSIEKAQKRAKNRQKKCSKAQKRVKKSKKRIKANKKTSDQKIPKFFVERF
jgi:hypothetical protein